MYIYRGRLFLKVGMRFEMGNDVSLFGGGDLTYCLGKLFFQATKKLLWK